MPKLSKEKLKERLERIHPWKVTDARMAILCRIEQMTSIVENSDHLMLGRKDYASRILSQLIDAHFDGRREEDWLFARAADKEVKRVLKILSENNEKK